MTEAGSRGPALLARVLAGALAGLAGAGALTLIGAPQLSSPSAAAESADTTATALWLLLSLVPGAMIGALASERSAGPAVPVARGLLIGLLWWIVWFLSVAPLLRGEAPTWDAATVAAGFPELIADLLQGAAAGLFFAAIAERLPRASAHAAPAGLPRVVVLGGGFAGIAAVQRLERLARRKARFDVTLISDENYLLFTPMLAEVAAGSLESRHISAPVRTACPRTRFVHGRARSIDLERRAVQVGARGRRLELPFDHLVLAVGSEPTYHGLPGLAEHALPLKTLKNALTIRGHVLACLDQADLEPDPARRRQLLTFCAVGAGFAGVEAIAELRDLVSSVLRFFPAVGRAEPCFVLVHSRERILPELSEPLAAYALTKLRERGIECRLGVRVAAARADALVLAGGEELPCGTIVWTAGNRPGELLDQLELERGRGGTLAVDESLRVLGRSDVWAAGDCAAVPDGDGGLQPPTAQHAVREGRAIADGIAATLAGLDVPPFRFRSLGALTPLGHRSGVAEIRGRCFSGALAWALWRCIYLAKLPGLEKRTRVALDWLLDLVFPRDIVLAEQVGSPADGRLAPESAPGAPRENSG
ncbi:MAG: NAD(P)/FAD-dependent oxidoreductase [Thermoleophilaceae bacterium]|nr:NAD(P)/FAD-dependent oxidoreductase [Thermoleophilaceae bacterium]